MDLLDLAIVANDSATDGSVGDVIGHAQGLIVDEESWASRYLAVNMSNCWLGHKKMVAPQ